MQAAAEYLQAGADVTGAARAIGSSSASNFARSFRSYFGVTPAQFRRR